MVARKMLAELAQPHRHHIEHRAGQGLRNVLGQSGDAAAELTDLAIVGMDLAGHEAHQRGLAGPVAAHDADALVGLDGDIDLFEQERAADAVVDVLK